MELIDVLQGISQGADFMARTQRGWVGQLATILAGATSSASRLLAMGKEPEEVRAVLENLVNEPPKRVTTFDTVKAVDQIIDERKKKDGLPPKAP